MANEKSEPAAGLAGAVLKVLSPVIRAAAIGGMCFLAAMMLMTTANVLARYLANKPIIGTDELVGLLLVCLTAAGLGYCQLEKGHVRVTILLDRLSKRGQAIVNSLTYIIGLVAIVLICYYLFFKGYHYLHLTRGNITEILGIYYYPFMFLLWAGFVLFALVLLAHLIESISQAVRNE